MFSDSIHECISTLIEEYLNYDNYSFYYKEQLINALSHLYSILYKLDIPPGLEEDLPIGVFKIWAKKSLDEAVFKKANCDSCLEDCSYCERCIIFKKNIEDFKREHNIQRQNNN